MYGEKTLLCLYEKHLPSLYLRELQDLHRRRVRVRMRPKESYHSLYHPSCSQTNCHGDGGQLVSSLSPHTHIQALNIIHVAAFDKTNHPASPGHTTGETGSVATFGVNLKSALGESQCKNICKLACQYTWGMDGNARKQKFC